jgi:UDP-N-acetylglucosamine 4,6-dehydratase (inverting)
MSTFTNKSILITGGTGSFGKAFLKKLINNYKKYKFKKIIIFSRDELKQFDLQNIYPSSKYDFLRYFIGDIRDKERLNRALYGVDIVIHAAALKQVPAIEYNPYECIKTNVLGAQNIIEASLDNNIKKIVALSTDKASSPVNLYGASKLCSDKLFISANILNPNRFKISIVRYGNVVNSRGSVIPYFNQLYKNNKSLPITHKSMTRFIITLNQGVEMVLWTLNNQKGGEIFVPKIPSIRLMDLVKSFKNSKNHDVGIRPGEKIHEELISNTEILNTIDYGKYYGILPQDTNFNIDNYIKKNKLKKHKLIESYNSQNNFNFLSVSQIRDLINSEIND